MVVALAVFSHWILDFLVHRPDLPLYDSTAKVGLGLWNVPAVVSDKAAAGTALAAYAVFAAVVARLERP